MPFATVDDLRSRWKGAAGEDDEALAALIEDASLLVRVKYPMIEESPEGPLADVLKFVVSSMIRRAANVAGFEGFSSYSETAGQFQQNFRLSNSGENLYVSASEQELIERALFGPERSAGSFTAEG